jgi:hypothetical protein
MYQDGRVTDEGTTKPPRRRRRAALLAVLFLLAGMGLLLFSATDLMSRSNPGNSTAAPPSRSSVPSTIVVYPSPTPGDTTASPSPPPPSPIVSIIAVPTFVPVPVPAQESGLLPLITTISGLLASLAGIVSAIVSVRGSRAR